MKMNSMDLQRLIDNPDSLGTVKLPAGEFEGPFTVSRPCHIIGNNTALWRRTGTVLEIRARGVTLENLQIEITGGAPDTAVLSKDTRTVIKNVFLSGNVKGISDEDGQFILPKIISVGSVEPDREFTVFADIFLSAPAEIKSEISGVSVYPEKAPAGKSLLAVTVSPVSAGSVIYGSLEVKTKFTRRIYLSMSSNENFIDVSGRKLFEIKDEDIFASAPAEDVKILPANGENIDPAVSSVPKKTDGGKLIKGQRANMEEILGNSFSAEFTYSSPDSTLDIDCYTFLLDKDGNAQSDDHLVFFGNTESEGAVKYNDSGTHKIVSAELDKLPPEIENIAIAYSVYGDDRNQNFSKVKDAKVIFRGGNGNMLEFDIKGLVMEKTVVAARIYRKNGKWKINAVGQGYRSGLRRLCESFGLNIED